MTTCTLLTDFGVTDYYVGAVKGTILRLVDEPADHRSVRLVDLGHDLPAGDVEAAADLLAAAAPTFPSGSVHLAVVDPGVGSDRRILAARVGGHHFVAPDNGLLTPFLPPSDRFDPETDAVHHVTRTDLFLPGPGATFHGRDRFAPTAAALLRGVPLADLGPAIDDPVLLEHPRPRREETSTGTVLHGRVTRVDRFGNLVTDLPVAWLGESRPPVEVGGPPGESHRTSHVAERWADHYAQLTPDTPGALVGSLGTVELSLRGRSLAKAWETGRGAAVRIDLRTSR